MTEKTKNRIFTWLKILGGAAVGAVSGFIVAKLLGGSSGGTSVITDTAEGGE